MFWDMQVLTVDCWSCGASRFNWSVGVFESTWWLYLEPDSMLALEGVLKGAVGWWSMNVARPEDGR
jgi:hypothetical protein